MGIMHVFEGKTPTEVKEISNHVIEAIKTKKFEMSKFSIQDLALGIYGVKGFNIIKDSSIPLARLREEVDPVNSTAFTNISNQIVLDGVLEGFDSPEFVLPKLVTEETSRRDGGRFGGIVPSVDEAPIIEEGGEYPDAKIGEDYIDLPRSVKRGLKIGITREAIAFDQTGDLIEAARMVGYNVGLSKEIRGLRAVLGMWNPYVKRGVAEDTYVAAGNRTNVVYSNALTDYTSFEKAMLAFADLKDVNTGRPIVVMPRQLIVSEHMLWRVRNIMSATEIRQTTGNLVTLSGNPVPQMEVISSKWIHHVLTTATLDPHKNNAAVSAYADAVAKALWFMGDFKRAFRYRTIFPLAVEQASSTDAAFYRDIVAEFKAGERGVAWVYKPEHTQMNTDQAP